MLTQSFDNKLINERVLFSAVADAFIPEGFEDDMEQEPPTLRMIEEEPPTLRWTHPSIATTPAAPETKGDATSVDSTDKGWDAGFVHKLLKKEANARLKRFGRGQAMLAAAEFVAEQLNRDHRESERFAAMKDAIRDKVTRAFGCKPGTDEEGAKKLAREWMDARFKPLSLEEFTAKIAVSAPKPKAPRKQKPSVKRTPQEITAHHAKVQANLEAKAKRRGSSTPPSAPETAPTEPAPPSVPERELTEDEILERELAELEREEQAKREAEEREFEKLLADEEQRAKAEAAAA